MLCRPRRLHLTCQSCSRPHPSRWLTSPCGARRRSTHLQSRERHEPPDIDVDFEHQRREEVIQRIYEKYGRHRAALAATLVTYRRRMAVRDVAKALGFPPDLVDA